MKPITLLRTTPPSLLQTYSSFLKPNKKLFTLHSFSTSLTSTSSYPARIRTKPDSETRKHEPKPPLFLTPPTHSTTQPHLHSFISWAQSLTSSVGSTFVETDNGPHSTLLLKELKWFLEDIVEDPLLSSQLGQSRNVEKGGEGGVVRLRVSLEEMYELWEERIVERRPFQYVVGCEHWRDLVLCVEEGVLIPRPETAKIVDLVEGVVAKSGGGGGGVWADLGTGSGALAIGIARVLGGNGRVVATDVSDVAVSVARYNVERYGLQDSVEVRQGSWFDPLMEFEGQLAGLVSNPPYIPSEDISGLQAEVGKHEPTLALDGGVEGLDYLTFLCMKTSTMLKPGGFFAFETNGQKQCMILADYLENATENSICDVKIVPDFAGVQRFVTGFRKQD